MSAPATECGPHCGIAGCARCGVRSWEERFPRQAREQREGRDRILRACAERGCAACAATLGGAP